MSRRTSVKITDKGKRQMEKTNEIVASGPDDDPPMSVVNDAAHLVQSEKTSETFTASIRP